MAYKYKFFKYVEKIRLLGGVQPDDWSDKKYIDTTWQLLLNGNIEKFSENAARDNDNKIFDYRLKELSTHIADILKKYDPIPKNDIYDFMIHVILKYDNQIQSAVFSNDVFKNIDTEQFNKRVNSKGLKEYEKNKITEFFSKQHDNQIKNNNITDSPNSTTNKQNNTNIPPKTNVVKQASVAKPKGLLSKLKTIIST